MCSAVHIMTAAPCIYHFVYITLSYYIYYS